TTHLTTTAGPRVSTTITSFDAGSAAHAYDPIIAEAGKLFRLEPALIRSVMQAESAVDPFAVSRARALGFMQLMPDIAKASGFSGFSGFSGDLQARMSWMTLPDTSVSRKSRPL